MHISVITVQRAYEDLTRDGFIETISGKGSFVASQNRKFIQEEQLLKSLFKFWLSRLGWIDGMIKLFEISRHGLIIKSKDKNATHIAIYVRAGR